MTIKSQLDMLRESREKLGDDFPQDIYEACVILVRNRMAFISGISEEGNPILQATELGHAQAEAWEQGELQ